MYVQLCLLCSLMSWCLVYAAPTASLPENLRIFTHKICPTYDNLLNNSSFMENCTNSLSTDRSWAKNHYLCSLYSTVFTNFCTGTNSSLYAVEDRFVTSEFNQIMNGPSTYDEVCKSLKLINPAILSEALVKVLNRSCEWLCTTDPETDQVIDTCKWTIFLWKLTEKFNLTKKDNLSRENLNQVGSKSIENQKTLVQQKVTSTSVLTDPKTTTEDKNSDTNSVVQNGTKIINNGNDSVQQTDHSQTSSDVRTVDDHIGSSIQPPHSNKGFPSGSVVPIQESNIPKKVTINVDSKESVHPEAQDKHAVSKLITDTPEVISDKKHSEVKQETPTTQNDKQNLPINDDERQSVKNEIPTSNSAPMKEPKENQVVPSTLPGTAAEIHQGTKTASQSEVENEGKMKEEQPLVPAGKQNEQKTTEVQKDAKVISHIENEAKKNEEISQDTKLDDMYMEKDDEDDEALDEPPPQQNIKMSGDDGEELQLPKFSEVKHKVDIAKPKEIDEDIVNIAANYQNQNIDDSDSYFFSYFMMICVVFIFGYVAYHNKQKILALVVEGRKGRRPSRSRRPNSSNYRKLDSTLEEAVTSSCNKNTTQVIY